jgi:hypothetical protein
MEGNMIEIKLTNGVMEVDPKTVTYFDSKGNNIEEQG